MVLEGDGARWDFYCIFRIQFKQGLVMEKEVLFFLLNTRSYMGVHRGQPLSQPDSNCSFGNILFIFADLCLPPLHSFEIQYRKNFCSKWH